MAFSRREFLKRLGIGAGAAAVGVALPKVQSEPEVIERHVINAEPLQWTGGTGTVTSGYIQITPYVADDNTVTTVSSTDWGEHRSVYYPDERPYTLSEMRAAANRYPFNEINK